MRATKAKGRGGGGQWRELGGTYADAAAAAAAAATAVAVATSQAGLARWEPKAPPRASRQTHGGRRCVAGVKTRERGGADDERLGKDAAASEESKYVNT